MKASLATTPGRLAGALLVRRRKRSWGLVAGLLLLAAMTFASLVFGSRWIAPAVMVDALDHFDGHNDLHLIVRELRIPRTLVALLAGAALGLSGSIMQAVTRTRWPSPACWASMPAPH